MQIEYLTIDRKSYTELYLCFSDNPLKEILYNYVKDQCRNYGEEDISEEAIDDYFDGSGEDSYDWNTIHVTYNDDPDEHFIELRKAFGMLIQDLREACTQHGRNIESELAVCLLEQI